jgi:hypothetical protein
MVTLDATNLSDSVIVWGEGSSTCQLRAYVRTVVQLLRTSEDRGCTRDIVTWALYPRQTRREAFRWDGRVIRDGSIGSLPSGRYRVFAAAGALALSYGIRVRVHSD